MAVLSIPGTGSRPGPWIRGWGMEEGRPLLAEH